MRNSIYTVKAGNGIGKLNATEKAVYEFLTTKEFEVGYSIGSQKFIKQFAEWNDDKMTVKASSIVSASSLKKVCKVIASDVLNNGLNLSSLPTVRANKQHGTLSIDFVNVASISNEYTENELKEKAKAEVNPLEFISNYMDKHEISIEMLTDFLSEKAKRA